MTNYLFSTSHCPMCDMLHKQLKAKGLDKYVTDVDCETAEGADLVAKYSIRHTPTLVQDTDASIITIIKVPEIVKALEAMVK